MKELTIYHLDDDPFYLDEFREKLLNQNRDCRILSFDNSTDLLMALEAEALVGILVLDINLKQGDLKGDTLVARIRKIRPDLIIVMCSDLNDSETVHRSLEWGADDFVFKGLDDSTLYNRLASLSKHMKGSSQVQSLDNSARVITPSMVLVKERIPRIIKSAITAVHVHGESGTGKELISEMFEQILPKGTPFQRIHCGAISPNLLESELFGHVKGSFTGAQSNKIGIIEQAHGGWIFLDEVATLSAPAQVALLRVLENQEIRPVGAAKERKVKIRIISATNESLSSLVKQGRFRADLWQRLCEATIDLLPLRDRMDEFPPIVELFCKEMEFGPYTITPGTVKLLSQYDWRAGNIRELRNCMRAMTEGAIDKVLTPATIPKHIWRAIQGKKDSTGESDSSITIPLSSPMESYESLSYLLLAKLIRLHTGQQGSLSIRKLSQLMQIPRSTLGMHIKKLVERGYLSVSETESYLKK